MNSRWITVPLLTLLYCTNAKLLGLEKGSFCHGGRCETLNECSFVGDFRKNKPEICSFQGITPIICCPFTAPFTSTKQAPTSTMRAPTSTKQAPTSTMRAPISTKQVPTSTMRAPISTKLAYSSTMKALTSTKQEFTSTNTLRTPSSTTKPSYISIPASYSSPNNREPAENKFKLTYTKGIYGGIRYKDDNVAEGVQNNSSLCDGGTCTLLSECTTVGNFKKTRPEICSFQGKIPIICCPSTRPSSSLIASTTEATTTEAATTEAITTEAKTIEATNPSSSSEKLDVGEKARRKCSEYEYKLCPCNPSKLFRFKREEEKATCHNIVVGGSKSKPRDLTFMAILGYGNDEETEWACGATLISTFWVLGAAHCEMTVLGQAKWIKLGDLNLESDTDDACPIDYPIQYSIIHPEYKLTLHYNDIALHKSKEKIIFDTYVKPICLETYVPTIYNRPWVAGWGMIEYSGARSPSLLQVELDFVRSSNCSAYYGKTKMLPSGINYYSQICAGSVPGKDACQGDSGGPLFQQTGSQCLKSQVGITSFGKMCGKGPGVYTWILNYLGWIEEIVWPQEENDFPSIII